MKKKWIAALLALTMLFALAACSGGQISGDDGPTVNVGGSGGSEPTPAPAKDVDLAAFVEAERVKYGEDFNCGVDLTDPDMAEMLEMTYPNITLYPTKQLVVCQPMMSAVVCEIVVAELEDPLMMGSFKGEVLQKRIDAQVDGGAFYPASVEAWETNSRIVENGSYVMMIAWEKCDEVVADFNALFA